MRSTPVFSLSALARSISIPTSSTFSLTYSVNYKYFCIITHLEMIIMQHYLAFKMFMFFLSYSIQYPPVFMHFTYNDTQYN